MSLRLGRYETIRVIGTGGMAIVYLGRSIAEGGFERLVALKVMHTHIANDPDFVAMFLDEARLAARIRHPNVVPTLDVQRAEGNLFLVMDYVEGLSLRAVIRHLRKKKSRIEHGIALRIMVDMLNGLHAAQELVGPDDKPLNLIHRDVTPHNILIGVDGVTRLTDFGVARAESRLSSTRGTSLKGKVAYMSREQLMAEDMDRRSDIYTAGAVLWEALVGRRLFKAPSDGALVAKILEGAQKSPRDVDPNVPSGIDAVCMRALSPKPADRYETALAFVEAIEDAAHEDGIRVASSRKVAAFTKDLTKRIEAAPATSSQPSMASFEDSASKKPAAALEWSEPSGVSGPQPSQPSGVSEPQPSQPSGVSGPQPSQPAASLPQPIEEPPTVETKVLPKNQPPLELPPSEGSNSHSVTSIEAVLPTDDASLPKRSDSRTKVIAGLAGAAVLLLVIVSLLAGGEETAETSATPAADPPAEGADPPSEAAVAASGDSPPSEMTSASAIASVAAKPPPKAEPPPKAAPAPAPTAEPEVSRPRPEPAPVPRPQPRRKKKKKKKPFHTDQL